MAKWNLEGWMLVERVKYQRALDEIDMLKSKSAKQRNEIARLTSALDQVTQEKKGLVDDIKWMKGEPYS